MRYIIVSINYAVSIAKRDKKRWFQKEGKRLIV
jgi:hypothetical protein